MARAHWPLLLLVTVFATTCACTRYHAESKKLSRRVQVVAYYRCQNPECTLVEPVHARVEILVDGIRLSRITEHNQSVANVYLRCGRIFAKVSCDSPEFSEFFSVLCKDGRMSKVWDVTDILVEDPSALEKHFSCQESGSNAFTLSLTYTVTDAAGERIKRLATHEVKELPCEALVLEGDGPPPDLPSAEADPSATAIHDSR